MHSAHYSHRPDRRFLASLALTALCAALLPAVPAFASQRTADSLVGYWKLDETVAGSFADSSGDGFTGTGSGSTSTNATPQPSTDVPSVVFPDVRSLSFDGTDDNVLVGRVSTATDNFSAGAWLKGGGAKQMAFYNGNDSAGWGVGIGNDGTVGGLFGGVAWINSGTARPTSGWYHLMLVRRSGTTVVYLNGQATGATYSETPGTPTSGKGAIGREQDSASFDNTFWNGQIDDVRVYNRALAPWEIAELAAGRHIPAYWKGRSGTAFERKQSWSGSYVPDPYSRIVARVATGSLTLTGAIKAAALTIQTGALVNLAGTGFTMNDAGAFINHGTLALKNSETLAGFTNDARRGTVMLIGTGTTTGLKTGGSYNNLTINDGLKLHLKFDEASGTRAADGSGYNNSGTLVGPTISTTAAPLNFHNPRSLSFDGNDYVTLPNPFTKSGFTMALWVKPTSINTGSYQGFIGRDNGGGWPARAPSLWVGPNNGYLHYVLSGAGGGSTNGLLSGFFTATGGWVHVTWVRNGGTLLFYKNGALHTSVAGPTNISYPGVDYHVGRVDNYLTGNIDDVRIYDRPLMPSEIAALAAGNQPSLQKGSVTLTGALAIAGSLTLNAGQIDVSSSNYAVSLSGSLLNNGGVFTARKGAVAFKGAQAGLEVLSGGSRFNDLAFQGGSATWNTRDRLTVSGALTINSGTLDASGSYIIRAGTWNQAGGAFTPRAGTVVLTNPSASTLVPASAYNVLQIEDPTENGLVGYWKFDEGTNSGSIVDSSGNGSAGTRRGTGSLVWTGSTLSSLVFDNPFAMAFNGVSDYADLGSASVLDRGANPFSLSLWFKTPTAQANWRAIAEKGVGDTGVNYGLWISGSPTYRLDFVTANGAFDDVFGGSAVVANRWYHAVATWDGTTKRLYIDGELAGSGVPGSTGRPSSTVASPKVGQSRSASFFGGAVDDVRVYDRALGAAEVKNLANGTYADGDSGTATLTLAGNLDVSTMTIVSGIVGAGTTTIDVSGDWNNYAGSGAFVAGTSTVDLDGAVTQNVRGSTAFSTFEISTSAAQTVKFGSGTTQYIATNLILQGAASNILTLSPLAAGYRWFLDLADSASQTIDYVTPSYSNASGGLVLLANDGTSTDGGNNANWLFVTPEVSFQSGALTLSETAGTATLVLTRSGSALPAITVPYSYAGTATGTGSDYTLVTPSPIVMAAGETSTGILLTLIDDTAMESDETIILTLGSPDNAVVGATGALVITLTSDDVASSGGGTQEESGGGGGGGGGGGRGARTNVQRAVASIEERYRRTVALAPAAPAQSPAAVPPRIPKPQTQPTEALPQRIAASALSEQRNRLVLSTGEVKIVYRDVVADAWYAPYVADVIERDIARGYRDDQGRLTGEFGVSNAVTYAEALKMALEAAGKTDLHGLPPARNAFARGAWFDNYLRLAEKEKLSVFTPALDPDAPATRGAIVQTVMEVLGLTIGRTPASYTDVPAHHPHSNAIGAATFFGLVAGDTDAEGKYLNTFRPDAPINRAEVAKIIALAREVASAP